MILINTTESPVGLIKIIQNQRDPGDDVGICATFNNNTFSRENFLTQKKYMNYEIQSFSIFFYANKRKESIPLKNQKTLRNLLSGWKITKTIVMKKKLKKSDCLNKCTRTKLICSKCC